MSKNPNERTREVRISNVQTLENGRQRITIAANNEARTGWDIDLRGLTTDNYMANPVVLWAHGRDVNGNMPIGKTSAINRKEDGTIQADFDFAENDSFADRVRNLWDQSVLRAASISWLPVRTESGPEGRPIDVEADLLEWSIVAVPADQDALRDYVRSMDGKKRSGDDDADSDEETTMRVRDVSLDELRAIVAEEVEKKVAIETTEETDLDQSNGDGWSDFNEQARQVLATIGAENDD